MADKKKSWLLGAVDKVGAQVADKKAQLADAAAKAGGVALQKEFGFTTVVIYDGGYVRLSKVQLNPLVPYERLLSIVYRNQNLEGTFTKEVKPTVTLTITTDRTVHTLRADATRVGITTGTALEAAGLAVLAATASPTAGPSGGPDAPAAPPARTPAPAPPAAPAAPAADVPDQIRKLADLHAAGILTDEEFTSKKADLLGRM